MAHAQQSICTAWACVCRLKPRILDHNLPRGAAPLQPGARRRSLRPSFGDPRRVLARACIWHGFWSICAPEAPRGEGNVHVLMVRTRRAHARSDAIHWMKRVHARRSRALENFGRQQRTHMISSTGIHAAPECSAATPASRPRRSVCARFRNAIPSGRPQTCQMRKSFGDWRMRPVRKRTHPTDRPETSESA